ncbi:glycosyltransferase family 4 protein [Evansella sp. AB-P1]|uniref:glycosyltransferase family 4 protein n=1 Tax=Evansella sp. AB-P1 TaxID=3037653 RepID=UPI00241E5675|nr:glycosyltransferase family 4 protein [Evansella sp. AB-P1]MDG5787885.1 glycosyltransferase family 4 protein [Evansella sp. AB-P1]
MKILYVTSRVPYPPHKGDQLIAYEQIKILGKRHDLYLVSFVNNKEDIPLAKAELGPYCKDIHFIYENKFSLSRVFKTLYNFKPLQVNLFTSNKNKEKMRILLNKINPDIVHLQTIRIAELFKSIKIPKVIDMIDAISLNMKRRAENESILFKQVISLESYLVKEYEQKVIRNFDEVLLVSEKDKSSLENNEKITINPNGTYITKDFLARYKDVKKEEAIVFHGNMQYYPNVEAVLFFVKQIWPQINKKYPGFKFYIVGKDPVKKIQKLNGMNNIVVTGFVEEIGEYLSKAMIGVYPLQSGTGMQNKILEALACGLPTVATPLALQGFPTISPNDVAIAHNKEETIKMIERLIDNEVIRNKYSKLGQQFIFNHYSWDKNVTNLEKIWSKAMEREGVKSISEVVNSSQLNVSN